MGATTSTARFLVNRNIMRSGTSRHLSSEAAANLTVELNDVIIDGTDVDRRDVMATICLFDTTTNLWGYDNWLVARIGQ